MFLLFVNKYLSLDIKKEKGNHGIQIYLGIRLEKQTLPCFEFFLIFYF